jgi:hypothetical protein
MVAFVATAYIVQVLGRPGFGLIGTYRFCFLPISTATAIQISYLPAYARAFHRGATQLLAVGARSLEVASWPRCSSRSGVTVAQGPSRGVVS